MKFFIFSVGFFFLYSINAMAFEEHKNGWIYPMNRKPTDSEWNSWHSYSGHVGHVQTQCKLLSIWR